MSQQLNTLYKLMTMYTLSRVDFALTNSQITNVFLDLGYTNYFNVQYALGELVDTGLVHEEAYPDYRYYALTESGRESIEALRSTLSASIRTDIDDYLKKMRLEFREATVPNETQAKAVSQEWKEKSQEIYAMVIHKLTQPDHIDRIVEEETPQAE